MRIHTKLKWNLSSINRTRLFSGWSDLNLYSMLFHTSSSNYNLCISLIIKDDDCYYCGYRNLRSHGIHLSLPLFSNLYYTCSSCNVFLKNHNMNYTYSPSAFKQSSCIKCLNTIFDILDTKIIYSTYMIWKYLESCFPYPRI